MRSIYYNIPTKDNRIWHKLMEESRFWARLYNKYNKRINKKACIFDCRLFDSSTYEISMIVDNKSIISSF